MALTSARRLAVIMHGDVEGSTTLVQRDESLAHDRMQDAFRRLSGTVHAYGGAVHEIRGDALVALFATASDAVCAALVFQARNADHNARIDDDLCPELRIGISLGEVVVADRTVTGAGVVLAQRLEQLAPAGGVVVQGSVCGTVPARLPLEFEFLGEQTLKGFDQPVRVFVAHLKTAASLPEPVPVQSQDATSARAPAEPPSPRVAERPSVAVLPFRNLSGDTEEDFFAEGITEEIMTSLGRFREVVLAARGSAFLVAAQSIDICEAARRLEIQYVLEGSVRRVGERVRITVELVEGTRGQQVWSERYDRTLEDIFSVQDDVARRIVVTLVGRIERLDPLRSLGKESSRLTAYECVLRGRYLFGDWHTPRDDVLRAREMFERALEIDPGYGAAHARLAATHL